MPVPLVNPTAPANPYQYTVPYPAAVNTPGPTINLATFMQAGSQVYQGPDAGLFTDAWLEVVNYSDSLLSPKFDTGVAPAAPIPPGYVWSSPIPVGATSLTTTIIMQASVQTFNNEVLFASFYTAIEIRSGFRPRNGPLVPNARGVLPPGYFPVNLYGATLDDTAIQAAINAASAAGGGVVLLAGVQYTINNQLLINSDNIQVWGAGRETVLNIGGAFPAATSAILVTAPGGAVARYGIALRNLRITNTAVTTATAIELQSTYFALLDSVDIEGVYARSVYLNGSVAPNTLFGAYTLISHCHIGNIPGGATSAGTGILTNNHESVKVSQCVINWFQQAGGTGINIANSDCTVSQCDIDECDTGLQLTFCHYPTVSACHFDRGVTRFIYNHGAIGARLTHNHFSSRDPVFGVGSTTVVVDSNGADSVVANNIWQTGTTWTNALSEVAGPTAASLYESNDFGGLAIVRLNTAAGATLRGNVGYNPQGANVAQPAVPSSGFAQVNTTGVDCMVEVIGGTVSQVAIGASNTGAPPAASAWYRVPVAQSITLTYTVAPTWTWYGD